MYINVSCVVGLQWRIYSKHYGMNDSCHILWLAMVCE